MVFDVNRGFDYSGTRTTETGKEAKDDCWTAERRASSLYATIILVLHLVTSAWGRIDMKGYSGTCIIARVTMSRFVDEAHGRQDVQGFFRLWSDCRDTALCVCTKFPWFTDRPFQDHVLALAVVYKCRILSLSS